MISVDWHLGGIEQEVIELWQTLWVGESFSKERISDDECIVIFFWGRMILGLGIS